jgi:hypothetical protein
MGKWVLKILKIHLFSVKNLKKSGIAERILARAPAGIDEKWVLKIKNVYMLAKKLQVPDSRQFFGQGFRRGRRKMGFKNQKCTCAVRKVQV